MDLNHLYAQHQILLMRAGSPTGVGSRKRLMLEAGEVAGLIWTRQVELGASAAEGWRRNPQPQMAARSQQGART